MSKPIHKTGSPPTLQRQITPNTPSNPARQAASPQAHLKPMAVRPRSRRRTSKFSTAELVIALGVGGFALIVLVFIAFFSLFVLFTLSDRILPGVEVGGTSIGGMKIDDASELLWADWNENRQLIVSDGEHYWMDTAAQFGVYLDSAATADRAYEIGRGNDGLAQFFGILSSGQVNVLPEIIVNMETAEAKLELYAEIIDVPATDAALKYENEEWSAQPGETGVALDIPRSLANLVTQRTVLMNSGYFTLTLMPVLPQLEDVSAALEQLQPLLNRSMRFQAYDPITDEKMNWTVEPETFAAWVRVENLGEDPELTIDLDKMAIYLQDWQSTLGGGRTLQEGYEAEDLVNAWKADNAYSFIVWHPATTYQVQAGDMLTAIAYSARMPYWKLIEANPQIDPENLLAGETLVIPSKNEMVPLPIVQNKRIVINISQQRMWTYENGSLLKEYVISTGIDDSPTLPGVYQVQTHELEAYASVWDLYMPHFMGIYQGWPGFWNGIHGLPTLSSGVRLWASVLGRKASFGCIILDLASAEAVYNWADEGVVVEIQP